MFWIGDKEMILTQSSSILGKMEDNPIYLIILDTSKGERDK
jgi:exopolysaccharide biosynthesis protein